MMIKRPPLFAFAAVALCAIVIPFAHAEMPAALVLDYSGPANARLSAFSELPDGAELNLGAKAKLTLLHYRSCKQINITGGKISVGGPHLTVTDGTSTEQPGEQCPQEVKVVSADTAAAAAFTVAPRLDCVVIGSRKADVASVEVAESGKEVLSIPVMGSRIIAAPGAPELIAGRQYMLVVKAIGGAEIKATAITVQENSTGKACLLRVD